MDAVAGSAFKVRRDLELYGISCHPPYPFSYASLGELLAWIIGWDLILEMALGAATVASGWSEYFRVVLDETFGVTLPTWIDGANHNFVAAGIVLLLTALLCFGIRMSTRVNAVVVAVKIAVVLLVIVAGLFYVKSGNLDPFVPPKGSTPAPGGESTTTLIQDLGLRTGAFGVGGIFTGAALVFFAFIGFDIVATAAEETRRPQRDLPIGIFPSLAICSALYVGRLARRDGNCEVRQDRVRGAPGERLPWGAPSRPDTPAPPAGAGSESDM